MGRANRDSIYLPSLTITGNIAGVDVGVITIENNYVINSIKNAGINNNVKRGEENEQASDSSS